MYRLKLGAGFDAEAFQEDAVRVPVGVECLGPPATARQGDHQLGMEALMQRVPVHELVQRLDQLVAVPEAKAGLRVPLGNLGVQAL